MSKEILHVAETVSNEKGVPQELIFQAIESAIVMATKKIKGDQFEYEVHIDRATGDYQTFRIWHVLDVLETDLEEAEHQLTVAQAQQLDATLTAGDRHKVLIDSIAFGRIAAQTAKQVIVQEIRRAERGQVAANYQARIGTLISGTVKKVTRDAVFLDVGGGVEATLLRAEIIPREIFRIGDRVRTYLYDVRLEAKGSMIFVSRTRSDMLVQLFRLEVPEIAEDIIEVMSAARDPGVRAKILVKTNDGRIDPVGACVGMRGSRVQAVSSELHGEKIDIVLWSDNPAQLVINSMAPAEIASIVVDEAAKVMDLAVAEEQLAQAIGRNGQNVRLASELTGWRVHVMTVKEFEAKRASEATAVRDIFIDALHIDADLADILVSEGFSSIEEVAYVPASEMADIEGFDEDLVDALRARAKDALLAKAIAEEAKHQQLPAEDLLALEGMSEDLADVLAKHAIVTREDLAEQAVADLQDITDLTDEQAAKLILAARAHWFV